MEKKHYYVHGDQSENKPAEFYCAMCDLFMAKPHFTHSHNEKTQADHLKRRTSSLLYVRRMIEQNGGQWPYQRSAGVQNLFDGHIQQP